VSVLCSLLAALRLLSPLRHRGPNLRSGHLLPDFGGGVGWEADRRLRMRNAEWMTLTLIEATLVEATLVWITHRLRRFANVR
jgi:hypothetical protein